MISKRIVSFLVLAFALAAGFARGGQGPDGRVSELLAKAERQIMEADTRDKALELIDTYEAVLAIDPENYEALWSLGRYHGLVGGFLTEERDERVMYLEKMLESCERGMMTNPEFRALIEQGESVPDAGRALTEREIAALFYWYTANGALWVDQKSFIKKILTLDRKGMKKVMNRMIEIDPEWAGGHPYHAYAVYYSVLPRILGGSPKKAVKYYDKAIEAGPNWLYIKFGRAQYLHTRTGDREAFIEDLEWVIAQDPKTADSPYPANVYFQAEAKRMLENVDDYF